MNEKVSRSYKIVKPDWVYLLFGAIISAHQIALIFAQQTTPKAYYTVILIMGCFYPVMAKLADTILEKYVFYHSLPYQVIIFLVSGFVSLIFITALTSFGLSKLITTGVWRVKFNSRLLVIMLNSGYYYLPFLGYFTALYFRRLKVEQWYKYKELKELQAILEGHFLKAQLTPHFIFNVLNSISLMAIKNTNQASAAIEKLGYFVEQSGKFAHHIFITWKEEKEMAETYLALEKMRFGEKLEWSIADYIPENQNLLFGTLLTLTENAVKHSPRHGGFKIELKLFTRISSSNSELVITVTNSFTQKQKESSNNTGLGLNNLKKRIKHYYKDAASFKIDINKQSQDTSLFIAELRLPQHPPPFGQAN